MMDAIQGRSIESSTFAGNKTVKNVTIPETVTSIDAESNVKVIDREHKYTIKENEDGEVIITDENDNKE